MSSALKSPVASPTPTSAKAPGINPSVDVVGVIVYEATTTHSVISAPTETSKPPTSSALVWPSRDEGERHRREQQIAAGCSW